MAFQSILYDGVPDYHDRLAAEMPAFFIDLNLDQVIDAVTAGKKEYDLKPFFYTPLHDTAAVRYRQEAAMDLERGGLLGRIKAFAEKMVIVRRYLNLISRLDYKYHKEGWFVEAALVYCDAVSVLAGDLAQADLRSRGFCEFRDYLSQYVRSAGFTAFAEETKQRRADLSTVQYAVILKGNWVRVRKYEGEPDYSKEVEQTFEKFKQGAVKDYLVKLAVGSGMNHVEAQILDCVAKLYPEIFAALDDYCIKHMGFFDETIRVFDREVQFYAAFLDFIETIKKAGLRFCYPEVSSESKEIFVHDGFDLALADKLTRAGAAVVCNDFYLKDPERIIVITGPNQGGKTTFARMFGQLHYLASLGLPVPGRQAKLFLPDRLFTHFEKAENIKNLRGKLQDDLVRIHDILEQAAPASIVIMNEIFTSTTLQDAVFLSKKVMERIIQLDLLCVCVTFIDELAALSEKTVSMVSTVVPDNPAQRTFKIIRRPSDGLAYAISIAEKYRLTYQLLKERIKG